MGRFGIAFKAFFRVFKDDAFTKQVEQLLDGRPVQSIAEPAAKPVVIVTPAPVAKHPPQRSDALTLLAVLQREARLVDFLKEPIAGYDDAQVGAAVREIHRDASAALDRLFALQPVRNESEGASVSVPSGYDAGRIRLVGNVTGQPPHTGSLAHAGWEATQVELPEWNGTAAAAKVIAPAEVELR